MKKPPYKIPSMAAIRRIAWNGKKIVSTFSGCGGSCLGFKMAGFRVAWASEFVPAARETYAVNHPGTPLDDRDIRKVKPDEIRRAGGFKKGEEIDVLEGSPPCASFSSAGKGTSGWGEVRKYSDVKQRTDDLFWEYCRLLRGLKPRVFVAENVAGLTHGAAKGYFNQIFSEMKGAGYVVEAQVLDAKWLGVPQSRTRTIFMGVREDLGAKPRFPTPLPYQYSIRDVLGNVALVGVKTYSFNAGEIIGPDQPAPVVMAQGIWGGNHSQTQIIYLEGTAIGKEYRKLRRGGQSSKFFNLVRADKKKPAPCVTASGGGKGVASLVHPDEPRKFTIPELRRLCGFPDDFALTGTFAQQWERLGRAVPPPMMHSVAEKVREVLDACAG